ncbi:MAG: type VI secretion system baseplate subunit TssG [Pseudomonadota bacterium]
MASDDRSASGFVALLREIEAEPWRFGFLSTLRRIDAMHPDKPGFGRSRRPSEDPLRLGQPPSMNFSVTEIESLEFDTDSGKALLNSRFLGLFGPNGPMPLHVTEYARDRLHNSRDATFTAFANLFHHRMLSLFYRAWANAQPAVSFDRGGDDRFAAFVGALQGLGLESLAGRDPVTDHHKYFYAGRFASQSRTAEGLQDVLRDFFDVDVDIREFVGSWLPIAADQRTQLGRSPETGTLALNATAGNSVWGCQHNFRIVVGPLDIDQFEAFLPGRGKLAELVALVRMYVGDELAWDLNLVLRGGQVPPTKLGQSGALGQTTWLESEPGAVDRDEAILHPLNYLA